MGRRAAFVALVITAAFVAARFVVYRAFPVMNAGAADLDAWSHRDALMCLPRALAFLACLAAMGRLGGLRRWGWRGSLTFASVCLLAGAGIGTSLGEASTGARVFDFAQIVRALWASVFVVLWEEACYRGLLYGGLRQKWSPARAALCSSAVFTVMHVQAQPVSSWPWIFAYGVICCAAMEEGASLPWLMIVHWFVDSAIFFKGEDPAPFWNGLGHVLLAVAALAGFALLDGERPRSK